MNVIDKAQRLIEYATGEPYGDGEVVTDLAVGYAEPGYGSILNDNDVIVFGNWNCRSSKLNNDPTLTAYESMPVRLARSLERVGANIEWLDEWTTCQDCNRAVRTQGDSYHWRPFYEWAEDAGPICGDCLVKDGADALTYTNVIDNPDKCVTWCEPSHVESMGFLKWEPGDEHTYESGWHPHQTDTPRPIFDAIKAAHPDAEVVFFLDESSQFYIRFSAYFRIDNQDGE